MIAYGFCLIAAAATLIGYGTIAVQGDWTILGLIIVLYWSLSPYLVNIVLNRLSSTSFGLVVVALLTSMIVSAIGLFAMHIIRENAMLILNHPSGMNCYGPLLEVGTPIIQFAVLIPGLLLVAWKKFWMTAGAAAPLTVALEDAVIGKSN